MDQGNPFGPFAPGESPCLAPLSLSLDPPGGPQGDLGDEQGPPPVLPRLQQQLLLRHRSQRLWLQRAIEERLGNP